MLLLRMLLLIVSFGFLAGAVGTVVYDIYLAFELNRILRRNARTPGEAAEAESGAPAASIAGESRPQASGGGPRPRRKIRWAIALKLVALAAVTSLAGKSFVVVPDGNAGVRVSQI